MIICSVSSAMCKQLQWSVKSATHGATRHVVCTKYANPGPFLTRRAHNSVRTYDVTPTVIFRKFTSHIFNTHARVTGTIVSSMVTDIPSFTATDDFSTMPFNIVNLWLYWHVCSYTWDHKTYIQGILFYACVLKHMKLLQYLWMVYGT